MSVEKLLDEMWVGVKCQSNVEIAGSPRNSFRASLMARVQTLVLNSVCTLIDVIGRSMDRDRAAMDDWGDDD